MSPGLAFVVCNGKLLIIMYIKLNSVL